MLLFQEHLFLEMSNCQISGVSAFIPSGGCFNCNRGINDILVECSDILDVVLSGKKALRVCVCV